MEHRKELLGQKLTLMKALLDETEKQKKLIAADDLDGLAQSIEARQALMDAIDGLDHRIAALPHDGRPGNTEQIRATLEQIVKLDLENRRGALAMAEGLKESSREVAVMKGLMAYAMPVDRSSKFVDKEG